MAQFLVLPVTIPNNNQAPATGLGYPVEAPDAETAAEVFLAARPTWNSNVSVVPADSVSWFARATGVEEVDPPLYG